MFILSLIYLENDVTFLSFLFVTGAVFDKGTSSFLIFFFSLSVVLYLASGITLISFLIIADVADDVFW